MNSKSCCSLCILCFLTIRLLSISQFVEDGTAGMVCGVYLSSSRSLDNMQASYEEGNDNISPCGVACGVAGHTEDSQVALLSLYRLKAGVG